MAATASPPRKKRSIFASAFDLAGLGETTPRGRASADRDSRNAPTPPAQFSLNPALAWNAFNLLHQQSAPAPPRQQHLHGNPFYSPFWPGSPAALAYQSAVVFNSLAAAAAAAAAAAKLSPDSANAPPPPPPPPSLAGFGRKAATLDDDERQRFQLKLPAHPPSGLNLGLDGGGAGRAKPQQAPVPPPRFQCQACGRSYSTFSGLSKHRQFHCSSQLRRQFGCKFCDKQYSSLGALKMHIRTHTLPCKCGVCGKAFSRPWLLQGHLRTHTGEKPFSCGHCGRAFADRSNLRAHLQTHSEVKKYCCKTCQKTFSRMSLLNKHNSHGCPNQSS